MKLNSGTDRKNPILMDAQKQQRRLGNKRNPSMIEVQK